MCPENGLASGVEVLFTAKPSLGAYAGWGSQQPANTLYFLVESLVWQSPVQFDALKHHVEHQYLFGFDYVFQTTKVQDPIALAPVVAIAGSRELPIPDCQAADRTAPKT